jgi:hypothetical protein
VAEYLRGGIQEKPATEKVLEKLSLPLAAQTSGATKVSAPITAPKMDEKKLESLAQASQPPPPAISAPEKKPVDLSKADEKLSSLLGGKK